MGPDVFISYARADSYGYAGQLASQLITSGLSCYIDQSGSPPGKQVPESTLKAAERSSVLVALTSTAAIKSKPMEEEIRAFPINDRPVVPVFFGEPDQFEKMMKRRSWLATLEGEAIAYEDPDTLSSGVPSDSLVKRIVNAVGNQRQRVRLRRAALFVMTLIIAGLLVLAYTMWQIRSTTQELANARQQVESTKQELTTQQSDLKRTNDLLDKARKGLEQAQLETKGQRQTTKKVWDTLQKGAQLIYPQPDLSCKDGTLVLDRPVSLYFYADFYQVSKEASALLGDFAKCYLRQENPPPLMIEGHESIGVADNVTNAPRRPSMEYGLALGERRANSVRAYLVAAGIPANKISTISYGIERPAYPLQLLNNRVEIRARR
jgi:outer membrane protein OmpA-like peptidoglycan-associated protein